MTWLDRAISSLNSLNIYLQINLMLGVRKQISMLETYKRSTYHLLLSVCFRENGISDHILKPLKSNVLML